MSITNLNGTRWKIPSQDIARGTVKGEADFLFSLVNTSDASKSISGTCNYLAIGYNADVNTWGTAINRIGFGCEEDIFTPVGYSQYSYDGRNNCAFNSTNGQRYFEIEFISSNGLATDQTLIDWLQSHAEQIEAQQHIEPQELEPSTTVAPVIKTISTRGGQLIKVYEPTEVIFANNGIKILHPLKAEVTKEDNGDYYAEFTDEISNLEYYQKGMIIRVPTPFGVQGFRCDNPEINNRQISCKAWHLTYDAKNYLINDAYAVDLNCNDALDHFNISTDVVTPFTTISDITTLISTRAVRKSLFEVYEWLASEEKYNGHFYRDNWTLGIKETVGEDRGVTLAYGKNITDITVEEDWEEVCTKILPYTTDGEVAITLDDTYVELDEELYDIPYSKVVEFDNELEEGDYESHEAYITAIKEDLQNKAEAYLTVNKFPKINYKVTAPIQNVSDVGDIIAVKHPKCNVDLTTQVVRIVYDVIQDKYINIEFGNFKKELKNFSQTVTATAVKEAEGMVKETKSLLEDELAQSTATINGVLGNSYVIYDGDKILVVDQLPKEDAVNVLRISNGGIGFSNSGINGTYTSAWTLDGTLNMQDINVINLTASLIKGGTLKLGGTNNSSGTFELYDDDNNLISVMDKQGLTVYALNGDYVKLNAEEGFVGYDADGTKSYWADGNTFHMENAEVENEIKIASKIKIVPVNTTDNVGVGFVAITEGE